LKINIYFFFKKKILNYKKKKNKVLNFIF